MHETAEEIARLDELLVRSRAGASAHLRDIVDDGRALDARDVATLLTGMKVVTLATTTRAGEPRISGMDGHFLHGRWTLATDGGSIKAGHLAQRPAVSVAHVDGERCAVFTHGRAVRLDAADPRYAETHAHWSAHYGGDPLTWGPDIRFYVVEPSWCIGYAADRAALRAELGIDDGKRPEGAAGAPDGDGAARQGAVAP